ncbi:uncharacterized protein TNCV_813551 [Trichonephila clavipes]|nr:uncharacterized protein TNCV_813551 [Trichonephila clavipes]
MLQLSARTATRIELIASNLEAKLANDVETCEFFSIQLDESTDAVDTAQLAISVKMVFDDFSTKEEFLKILPLTARTQGRDIFSLFKKFAVENKFPLQKLSSITTDGARAMTENENTECKDLLLHTEVRWLTRGKVLEHFINLLPQVKNSHIAEWYRYRTVACLVTSSSPVPLKTRRVGQRCTLNLSRAETSSCWCGVVVRRGGASSGVVHVT